VVKEVLEAEGDRDKEDEEEEEVQPAVELDEEPAILE